MLGAKWLFVLFEIPSFLCRLRFLLSLQFGCLLLRCNCPFLFYCQGWVMIGLGGWYFDFICKQASCLTIIFYIALGFSR